MGVKVCPVCKAACFDDMEVCYGCLHRFAQEREEDLWAEFEQEDLIKQNELSSECFQVPVLFGDRAPRGFKITLEPVY